MTYNYEVVNGKTVRVTLDDTGNEITREHVPTTDATLITSVKTTAAGAVGKPLTILTAAEVRSLMAILLFKAGGVAADGTVRALNKWV